MTSFRGTCLPVFLLLALSGCGPSKQTLTEPTRQTITEKGLEEIQYYLESNISLRSIRELDTTSEQGPFKPDLHRVVEISSKTPGRFVAAGDGWIKVDFGQGVVLTFTRNASDGIYSMRGWGTFTVEGERYDLRVGVRSGEDVKLHYEPGPAP